MIRIITPLEAIRCFIICAGLIFLAFDVRIAQATQTRTHDLGDFKFLHDSREGRSAGNTDGTGQWPQDVYWSGNFTFIDHMRFVGSWMDETGELQSKTRHGRASVHDSEEPYTITEYRRYEPPDVTVYVNGTVRQSSPLYTGEIDPTLACDMMVVNRFKTEPGFHGISRSYSLSNSNHDDYIIFERTYTFTGDDDDDPELDVDPDYGLHDVYFILGYCMQTAAGTWITYSRWYEEGKDEWTNYESVSSTLVPGARDLAISYSWDGNYLNLNEFEPDNPGPNGAFDDTGDPRWGIGSGGSTPMPSGEFVSATYNGFAVLHADESPSNKSDNVSQPLSIISNVSIYDLWDDSFGGQYASLWDWAASGDRQDITTTPGWPDDPNVLEGDYPFQAIGPYDFALGDSITIVHVVSSRGISRSLSIEKGLEWRSWYRGEAGATFDDAAKNALLATGKDSLFQSLDRAHWAWSRGLDVPDPLPAPDLSVISGINRIDLEWEDMSDVGDPDTGVPDLDHYNIYRKRGSLLVDTDDELNEDGTHLLWELIATVPATQTTYTDEDLIDGESYHYAVTAVDDGTQNIDGLFPGQPLESSPYKNRSEVAAIPFVTPDSVGEGSNVSLINVFWQKNECTALAVHENMGYFGFGNNLKIVDLNDLSNISEVGEIVLPNEVQDIAVSGNYAYVADLYSGLRIIDISNPSGPVEAGYDSTGGSARGIAVSGNYAYVAVSSRLVIIDISNPTNPVETGSYNVGSAYDIAISGNYVYVAAAIGLSVIDISNPAIPTEVGYVDTPGDAAWEVAVSGNYAYVAAYRDGLRIIDISNPVSPVEVGSFGEGGYSMDVAALGTYVYLADGDDGLQIIETSNPAIPVLAGYFDTNYYAYRVTTSGNYVYLAEWDLGIIVLQNDLLTDIPDKNIEIPREYKLFQNFPNPFNPTTTIRYDIPSASLVQLKIYDTTGRLVTTLVDENKKAGEHFITWDAGDLSSGVYYYRIQAGNYTAVKKSIFMK